MRLTRALVLLAALALAQCQTTTPPPVDPEAMKHGALDVVASDAAGEAEFHKFLAVDAAPIGWGCTLLASLLALVQVRGLRVRACGAWAACYRRGSLLVQFVCTE